MGPLPTPDWLDRLVLGVAVVGCLVVGYMIAFHHPKYPVPGATPVVQPCDGAVGQELHLPPPNCIQLIREA
jgi:hypothetical protein